MSTLIFCVIFAGKKKDNYHIAPHKRINHTATTIFFSIQPTPRILLFYLGAKVVYIIFKFDSNTSFMDMWMSFFISMRYDSLNPIARGCEVEYNTSKIR